MTASLVRRSSLLLLVCGLFLALIGGCQTPAKSTSLPTVRMQIGNKQFTLEVADDESTRETGLMYRDSMPDDHGMLFVFSDETERGFWMKNTHIRLDILFVAADGKVVSIRTMEPLDLRTTHSDGIAKYAIELNAGAANASGSKAGDQLVIPATVKAKE